MPADGLGLTSAWQSRLWRKNAWVLSLLLTLAIVAFGVVEMFVSYGESLHQIGRLQQSQAREVTQALEATLAVIQRQVEAVTVLPWSVEGLLTMETRREEYARLLRLMSSVESVAFHDSADRELLMVSRRTADRWSVAPVTPPVPAAAASAAARTSGAVEYSDDYDPYLLFDIAYPEPAAAGRTLVRVALRALARELSKALTLPDAEVYVVEASGTVVLHRDPSVVLERRKLRPAALSTAQPKVATTEVRTIGLRGGEVLRSVEPVSTLGWSVVVEQPLAQAMAPVWATLQRTAAFMVAGLALASVAAVYLAGRLTRPIRELHQGVRSIGAGSLTARVDVRTGDELESLASRFNEMADSLNASYSQLESRVAEKTHELEQANRHKSDFLARMSHELRTPLNAIIGNARLLLGPRSAPLDEDQRGCVEDMLGAGADLLEETNNLLDLSKIEAGRLELSAAEFDVVGLVASVLHYVRERAEKGAVTVELALAPDLHTWSADERHLRKVLSNLLVNAVKFTDPGGLVKVRARLAGEEGLRFDVSDTGIGIAEADQARIFETFRQVQDVGKRNAEGIGLGLPLVKQLVELHGGRISVASRLGEGSTFTFNIPWIEPT